MDGAFVFLCRLGLVVILQPKVRNQTLALDMTQSVLQLHGLDKQIVLRVQSLSCLRRLQVEAQPLLNTKRSQSSAIGAARIESRQRKSSLICIG